MANINEILKTHQTIALYGLGTETPRFLQEYGPLTTVVGLLDGYRVEGELYGYPILTMEEALERDISAIIVVARPGSCKVIAKNIGETCENHGVALFDVRGKDLLMKREVSFDFSNLEAERKSALIEKMKAADVISFDLFDTLVMRRCEHYTDVFALVDCKLRAQGIEIKEFSMIRISAEKELSKHTAPTLEQIYGRVLELAGLGYVMAPEKMAELEWEADLSLMIPRPSMVDLFQKVCGEGKRVCITTDSYYHQDQIESLLKKMQITGYEKLFVSSEYKTAKTGQLFEEVRSMTDGVALHIGDDEWADVECAYAHHLSAFRIYSAEDLWDTLGGLGIDKTCDPAKRSLADRIKIGLVRARLFADPFCFEKENLAVSTAEDVGYLLCGPMIADFVIWMRQQIEEQGIKQILFGARDGYLIERLYRKLDPRTRECYFLTSRTAAIRAGMETEEDIAYVDGMKYFGSLEEETRIRFGIDLEDTDRYARTRAILDAAKRQRKNYQDYIKSMPIADTKLAFFDFVAKGTTQLYLSRLFKQPMKGFYFLQLEPEYMADKGLEIQPFYSQSEKDDSAIFDHYYILETMLTAPDPQLMEWSEGGNPVFAEETRSRTDIECFGRAQEGIEEFFADFISSLPPQALEGNKALDEAILSLVGHVRITDSDFLQLTVEDPFFRRMTNLTDLL